VKNSKFAYGHVRIMEMLVDIAASPDNRNIKNSFYCYLDSNFKISNM
jgi:hypothetical protein